MDVPAFIASFIQAHPNIVWVYVGGFVVSAVLNRTYPEENERPRLIVALIALSDVLQLNGSGFTRTWGLKSRAASP